MKKLLVILLLALVITVSGFAKVKSVRIYHEPWDTLTFVDMSADELRKNAAFVYEIADAASAEKFVSSLEVEKMSEGDRHPVSDLRLIIEVTNADGSLDTFVASRFEFGDSKTRKKRSIDEAFRGRFSALYEKKG